MFIEALITITQRWKQPQRPSAGKCINQIWYIYTMEYYEILIHAVIQMTLKM